MYETIFGWQILEKSGSMRQYVWNYIYYQSALVGDRNGIRIFGLYHFVSEEFDHNVANYISS